MRCFFVLVGSHFSLHFWGCELIMYKEWHFYFLKWWGNKEESFILPLYLLENRVGTVICLFMSIQLMLINFSESAFGTKQCIKNITNREAGQKLDQKLFCLGLLWYCQQFLMELHPYILLQLIYYCFPCTVWNVIKNGCCLSASCKKKRTVHSRNKPSFPVGYLLFYSSNTCLNPILQSSVFWLLIRSVVNLELVNDFLLSLSCQIKHCIQK